MDNYLSIYEVNDPQEETQDSFEDKQAQKTPSMSYDFEFAFKKVKDPDNIPLDLYLYLLNSIFEQYPEQYIDISVQQDLYNKVIELDPDNTLNLDGFKIILYDLIFSHEFNNTNNTQNDTQVIQDNEDEIYKDNFIEEQQESFQHQSKQKKTKRTNYDDYEEEQDQQQQDQQQQEQEIENSAMFPQDRLSALRIKYEEEQLTQQNCDAFIDIIESLNQLDYIEKDDFQIICQECNILDVFNQIIKYNNRSKYNIPELQIFQQQFEIQFNKIQQQKQLPFYKFDKRKSVFSIENDILEDYNGFMNVFMEIVDIGLQESQQDNQDRMNDIFKRIKQEVSSLDEFIGNVDKKFKLKDEDLEKINFDQIQLTKQLQNVQQLQQMNEKEQQIQYQEVLDMQEQYRNLEVELDKKQRLIQKLEEEQIQTNNVIQDININNRKNQKTENTIKIQQEEMLNLQSQNNSLRKELQEMELKYENLKEQQSQIPNPEENSLNQDSKDQSFSSQKERDSQSENKSPSKNSANQKILKEFDKLIEENSKYQETIFKKNQHIENITIEFEEDMNQKNTEVQKLQKNIDKLEEQIDINKKKEYDLRQQLLNLQNTKKLNLSTLFHQQQQQDSNNNLDQQQDQANQRPTLKQFDNNFELDYNNFQSRQNSMLRTDDYLFSQRGSMVGKPSIIQQNLFVVNESQIEQQSFQNYKQDSQIQYLGSNIEDKQEDVKLQQQQEQDQQDQELKQEDQQEQQKEQDQDQKSQSDKEEEDDYVQLETIEDDTMKLNQRRRQQVNDIQQSKIEYKNMYIQQLENTQNENLILQKKVFELESQEKQMEQQIKQLKDQMQEFEDKQQQKQQQEEEQQQQDQENENKSQVQQKAKSSNDLDQISNQSKIKDRASEICQNIIQKQKQIKSTNNTIAEESELKDEDKSKQENESQEKDNQNQENKEDEDNKKEKNKEVDNKQLQQKKQEQKPQPKREDSKAPVGIDRQVLKNLRKQIKRNQYLENKDFLNLKRNLLFRKIATKNGILADMKVIFSERAFLFTKKIKKRQDCMVIINRNSIYFLSLVDFKPIAPAIELNQVIRILLSETSQTMVILELSQQRQTIKKVQPVLNQDQLKKLDSINNPNYGYLCIESFKRQDLVSYLANIYKSTQKKRLLIEFCCQQNEFFLLQNYYDIKPKTKDQLQRISARQQSKTEESLQLKDNLFGYQLFNCVKYMGYINIKTRQNSIYDRMINERWQDQFVVLTDIGFICLKSPTDKDAKIVPITSQTIVKRIPMCKDRRYIFTIAERLNLQQIKQQNPKPLKTTDLSGYQQNGEVFATISERELVYWVGIIKEFQEKKSTLEQKQLIDEYSTISNVEGNLKEF